MNTENFLIPLSTLLKETKKYIYKLISRILFAIIGVGSQVIFFYFFMMNDPILTHNAHTMGQLGPHMLYGLLGMICIMLLFFTPYPISHSIAGVLIKPFEKYLTILDTKIQEIQVNISKDIYSIQSLNEILTKLESSQELLEKMSQIRRIIFNQTLYSKWREVLGLAIIWLLQIIENLRSDLTTRLTEQQSALESAKSEVEKKIIGTPELLAVSELQKTRLDRQIEQFEELQKRLVRV